MPQLRPVSDLRKLCILAIAKSLHESLKVRTLRGRCNKGGSSSVQEVLRLRLQTAEVLKCLPSAAAQDDLFDEVKTILLSEKKTILDEDYYKCLGSFWNDRASRMVLDSPRLFQDSSVALESFVGALRSCTGLRELRVTKNVVDLACFDFADAFLRKVVAAATASAGGRSSLESLTLQGLNQVEVDAEEMLSFIILLVENCSRIQYLDLGDSSLDNECCEILSTRLPGLRVLKADRCLFDADGATRILSLPHLLQFSCGDHLHDLASAEEGLSTASVPPLTSVTLRHLHGLGKVARAFPTVENVKVVYNEFDTDSCLDDALGDLLDFPAAQDRLKVELDMNGANLLIPIQFVNLFASGRFLVKLTLSQCEFLHPQTLNPWSRHCPSLSSLSLFSCQAVTDAAFAGSLPSLERTPFPALTELTLESSGTLPVPLARYLMSSGSGRSGRLRVVGLHIKDGVFPSECLELLLQSNCWSLEELRLSVERIRTEFPEMLQKLVEECQYLNRLELLCSSECEMEYDLEWMEAMMRRNNWDIKFLYHVKPRPRNART